MRLYISADMEGVYGVASRSQLGPGEFEYERARVWMTDCVASVCETASANGVDEIVVSDSHGNAQNLLVDRLARNVKLVRGWPRPLCMMQGIELGPFAGAVLLGYHTSVTNPEGGLAHTLSGTSMAEIRLNGVSASEAYISAATAGHFGVPVIMGAGDDSFIAETKGFLPDIAEATLKYSYGTRSALVIPAELALERLRAATLAALSHVQAAKPFCIEGPIEVDIVFRNRMVAEYLSFVRVFERLDAHTLRYRAENMEEASRYFMFLLGLNLATM